MNKKVKIISLIFLFFFLLIPLAYANKIISGRAPAHKIVGPNASNDFNYFLSAAPVSSVVSGTNTGTFTLNDINFITTTGATIDYVANIGSSILPAGSVGTFTSVDTSVATIDQNGLITRVADGTSTINLKVVPQEGKYLTKQIKYYIQRLAGQDTSVFSSYVTGSLARHIYDDIDTRINGVTASDATTKLFSTENHTTPSYVWNTQFWGYGIDLTPISPWNSSDPARRGGVLISPRHLAFANHFPIPNGSTVRFIKQDGTVITRTITSQAEVGITDIQVALLDSDVPSGIGFAKVLPANYRTYLPSLTSTTTIPCLNLLGGAFSLPDTDKQGYLREMQVIGGFVNFYTPTIAARRTFYGRDYLDGDSGNPNFLIINSGLVLLDTTSSASGFGASFADNITAINSVMTSLGGGYSLTTVDLSGFNAY